MKHTVIATVAHVDAGKTTLNETMLYLCGHIRTIGRVDHQDAFLDYDEQERDRGITIYAKQAELVYQELSMSVLDTPGHVDFAAEMERTLQVLDYVILVISALDGVTAHTETIWRLLREHSLPVVIFVNKMDLSYRSKEDLLHELNTRLHSGCVDMNQEADKVMEEISLCREDLFDRYASKGYLEDDEIAEAICSRDIFPCYFGSALKLQGVRELLEGMRRFVKEKQYPSSFGARVFKISHDEQGNRMTHVKVTGGILKAKMMLNDEEKADQLRVYCGHQYEVIQEAAAGTICAVKGLKKLRAGDGIGIENKVMKAKLHADMCYRMVLPPSQDCYAMMKALQPIIEEDPQLQITYSPARQAIHVQLMGDVQMEVLQQTIKNRCHVDVSFDEGRVNYQETIQKAVEGIGHYEPLRHYAEVHLWMEPLPLGSGIQIDSQLSCDQLELHWQHRILSHIQETTHVGVLTGSPITDMKITLVHAKAHQKHTEGGDFRQATYRAIRQGLMKADMVLLEPYGAFTLTVPADRFSKAIYDLDRMQADYTIHTQTKDATILQGVAPIASLQGYPQTLRAYTKGKGAITWVHEGYRPCTQQKRICEELAYDPDRDLDHPSSSIFCAKGSGFSVPWNEVEQYMHLPRYDKQNTGGSTPTYTEKVDDKELQRVFEHIYGKPKPRHLTQAKAETQPKQAQEMKVQLTECILVDGYNMIHSWENLRPYVHEHMDTARRKLIDLLNNYQGYRGCEMIVVFDAYRKEGQKEQLYQEGKLHVIYTKQSQTADSYIERATHQLAKQFQVIVATSDALEQLITAGQGAMRISAREFYHEVMERPAQTAKAYADNQPRFRNQALEKLRKMQEDNSDTSESN